MDYIQNQNWNTPSLSSTPTQIFSGRKGAVRMIQNWGAKDILIGGSDVTATTPTKAFVLKGNQTVPLMFADSVSSAAWYAISSDGSAYTGFSCCEIY